MYAMSRSRWILGPIGLWPRFKAASLSLSVQIPERGLDCKFEIEMEIEVGRGTVHAFKPPAPAP